MDFAIPGCARCSTVVHDEVMPSRLVEKVLNACLFVEEAMSWIFDGDEDRRILGDNELNDVDDVDKQFIVGSSLIG